MIHRKWSLLTGPTSVVGAVVGVVVVSHFIFIQNGPFLKPKPRSSEAMTLRK